MSEEKLNVSVKIDTQYCLRLMKKVMKKIIKKPYPDRRFKKGFVLRPFNLETGQFTHTTNYYYWKNNEKKRH